MSISSRTFLSSFNGGELSPLLDCRADAAIYRNGCRTLENFVVRPYGGAFKRPGTQYGGAVKTANSATRLIPFKRSTSTNYVLELGNQYMRFWKGGSSMTQITSGTPVEVSTPWTAAQIFAVQFCQINDVMFFTHPSHAPRRLTRNSETSWTLEVFPFDFPPMGDVNDSTTTITVQPNVANWATSTAYTVGQCRLQNGVLYYCATAHTSGTFATDLAANRWKVATPRGPWVRDDAYVTGDIVDAAGVRYACIAAHAGGFLANYRPAVHASWATYWVALGDSGLRLFSSSGIFASTDVDTFMRLDIGSSKRSMFLSTYHGASDIHVGEPIFAMGSVLMRSTLAAPGAYGSYQTGVALGELYLETSTDRVNYSRVRHWGFKKVTDGNISATYEGPSIGAWYRIRWENGSSASVTPDQGFFIECVQGAITGLFKITGYTSTTEVTATFSHPESSFAPCELLGLPTRNWYRGAFRSVYPRSVAFHDSRLWFGGVDGDSSRLWGSRIDDFYNFLTGAQDSDGIDKTLSSTETNQIEWMTSFGRNLVVGTTGEEWVLNTGESDSVLTAANVRTRLSTRNGSASQAPQLVGDALLWPVRKARRIHEFSYDFSRDAYTASDMTQFAEHVGASGFVDLDYSAEPDSTLWAVNGDGELCGFTYDRAQSVTAWHRHVTDGAFESVATIYGDNGRDEVWFVVRRTIGGSTVRYIERFYPTAQEFDFDTASDFFYVDSGLKVTPSGTSVTGLSHLNGKTVSVWADGARIESKVVSGGAITLSQSASTAIVGLPMTSTVQPMRLEVMLDDGTGQGRKWRPNRVVFCVHESIGGEFSDDGSSWQSIDYSTPYEREQGDAASTTTRTGRYAEHIKADWSDSVDFQVRHASPTPFNLLAFILVHEVEGK